MTEIETAVPPPAGVRLQRALGRWDLTAVGVNQVIGSAIFLMPAQIAAQVGSWGPVAFLLAGLASLLVALCFAEVGSRFDRTGGPYLYAGAAFGRFAAFEVGWMQWVTRVTSQASVANGIVLALGFYWTVVTAGVGRLLVLTTLIVGLAAVHVRGIRHSAWLVNTLTIGKLLPLVVFIVIGVFFIDVDRFGPLHPVTWTQASSAALLLIFTFGGYEVVPVPAGEASDPRRHLAFAMVATIVIVTAVMTLAQIVAMGTLPDLAAASTPLAASAGVFMGGAGALLIGIGSVISMTGNNAGQVLSGSRMLFALAEHGDLPRVFARVHHAYRTPANAVLFTSAVALVLAASGSFVALAAASAVARLLTYTATCLATLRLRHPRFAGTVPPATFTVPLGPFVPVCAVLVSLAILAGVTRLQVVSGLAALAGGAALFVAARREHQRGPSS
jgi:basic amino acid/polyamine antiporter, APA family